MGVKPESMAARILEHCRVAPPLKGQAAAAQTLPLTFLDVPWLYYQHTHRLLFYRFPCSKTHFLGTIVPNFKQSLSQTLTHFFPLAGNLIHPHNSEILPEIRYVPGDSVPVTVAESTEAHDFKNLIGNHPRVADEFYAFFTHLPSPESDANSESEKIAIFTAQITLFPDEGICVGFNNHHIVGDASSIVRFIKAWSSVAKFWGDDEFSNSPDSLPIYDRSLVKDPSGLLKIFWNQMTSARIQSPPLNFPINKLRSTYTLQKRDIQKLRDFVQSKKPHLTHLSPFTIASAYVWTCLVKSAAESGDEVAAAEPEYFVFAVDARQRMDPPVPAAYFGNCIGIAVTQSTHAELRGDDGFLIAVELIGDVISNKVNRRDELIRDADELLPKLGAMVGKRIFSVTGSPKFDLYDADFGWGKAEKYEAVAIDGGGEMSLSKSRESDGGLEIGLSLSKKKMDAFANIFSSGFNF